MPPLRAGSASIDITPDQPVPLSGYPTRVESPAFRDGPRPDRSTGVRDPIAVRSLVLDDGATTVAVVAADLLNVYHEFTEEIRTAVADLDIDQILLTATHTHSAPYMPGAMIEINPFLTFDEDPTAMVESIQDAFIRSIREAHAALAPATLRVGKARNDVSPVNRRNPEGPIDSELFVVLVSHNDGTETALVNFACHPVCLSANTAIVSADYLSTVYERIKAALEGATTLFVNGAAGNINPRDLETRYDDESAYTDEIGAEVAETALSAIDDARSGSDLTGPVVGARHDLSLPLRRVSDPERQRNHLEKLAAKLDGLPAAGESEEAFDTTWEYLYLQEQLNLHELDADSVPASMQYIGVGEFGLISFPGEAFVQHGLDLKAREADRDLGIAGFANEYVGYLPTREAMDEEDYEIRTCKVTAEAIEQVRQTAFDLLSAPDS